MLFKFADIEIDSEGYQLHRNGKLVDVEPLIFDLLVHLVKTPNVVLSRDELIDAVWSGRLVSDSTVSSAIKGARKALGDSGDKQEYIETVRGRGFRFIGKIQGNTPQQKKADSQVSIDKHSSVTQSFSIIVLPIKNLSESPTLMNFHEEFVADLEAMLTRVPLLQVSTHVKRYSHYDVPPTARQIHEEIGVHYLIEGNIINRSDQIRLNLQLIDAKAGFCIWTERFSQTLKFNDESTDQLLLNVIAKLEPQINKSIYNKVRSIEGQANSQELYLQASGLLALKGWYPDTFIEAADLLRRSEKLDPTFAQAPAYLALVLALGHRVGLLIQKEQTKAEAIAAADRALQLDNMDSIVLGYTGCALADLGMPHRAKPLLKNALQINPSNAQAWSALGSYYLLKQDISKAIEHLSYGISISPLDSRLSVWGALLSLAYLFDGDLENARNQAEAACERNDNTYLPRIVLAAVLAYQSNIDSARETLAEAYRIKPDLSIKEIDGIIGEKLRGKLLALR